jgi:hypothetical protein
MKTTLLVLRIPADQKQALARIERRDGMALNSQLVQAVANWIALHRARSTVKK